MTYKESKLKDGRNKHYCNEDWRGRDLRHTDFSESTFEDMCLDDADLSYSNLRNVVFKHSSFRNAKFQHVILRSAIFYETDLTGAHLEGANFYGAVLNDTILDDVTYNDHTKFFTMRCPEEGAFIGYKKCQEDRIVQLLIPADAQRSSATWNTCRCSKAKVLSIKSIDKRYSFSEAVATITDDFVYRLGEWVEADSFDPNRWHDASNGIHFWMTWDEAINY